MRIKKKIKQIGKGFVGLKQVDEKIIRQSVLIVDNGYNWLGHLSSGIERIKSNFPKAQISVLTLEQRKSDLQNDFSTLHYIHPSRNLKPQKYQIALQMLRMRKKEFNFIVLFSLDISLLIIALIFLRSKVILYNQWGQWWLLRLKKIKEIFKVTYIKKKRSLDFKNFLKRIGLFFVLLKRKDEGIFKHSILIIDSGHTLFDQIKCGIQRIKESLPGAEISLLTLEERREFKDNFPDLKIIPPDKFMIKNYRIARHVLRLRKNKYDYVILLSLDITLIIASILFINSKVILYNQWHQWWLLNPKPISAYLTIIPQFIFNLVIFAYLLVSFVWIFLKRSFNVFKFYLSGKEV